MKIEQMIIYVSLCINFDYQYWGSFKNDWIKVLHRLTYFAEILVHCYKCQFQTLITLAYDLHLNSNVVANCYGGNFINVPLKMAYFEDWIIEF